MAKYYLDDQEFNSHSEYAKALKEKNKELKQRERQKIQADLDKQLKALDGMSAKEIKKSKVEMKEMRKSPELRSVDMSSSGLKHSFREKQDELKYKVENSTTYKQANTVKEWKNRNNAIRDQKQRIKDTDDLGAKEKKAQLKKISQLKRQSNAKAVKEGLNNMKVVQKFKARMKRLVESIKAALPWLKWILIISLVVTLLWNGFLFFKGIVAAVGGTPHFYCELEADRKTQKSAFYQQYCDFHTGLDLAELNGHYIIQDGSGPCTACATLNLLMRYYTANGVNFFDYLWDEDGHNVYTEFPSNSANKNQWYYYISNAYSTTYSKGSNRDANAGLDGPGSWHSFAASHGNLLAGGWDNIPNWGFYFSEDIYEIGSWTGRWTDGNWTYDVDGYGSLGGGVWGKWYANTYATNGKNITIDGVTATFVFKSGTPTQNELISLLQTHPSGVAFVYSGHGMLLTKYEDGVFWMVDSGKYRSGGYEGPANNSNFCIKDYSHIANPSGWNGYWYIEEDTGTPTS